MKSTLPALWYTVGPASLGRERTLLAAGATGARLTFSFGTPALQQERARALKQAAAEAGRPLTVVADLAGEKLRLGVFDGPPSITAPAGTNVRVVRAASAPPLQDGITLPIPSEAFFTRIHPGDLVTIGDGAAVFLVQTVDTNEIRAEVTVGGVIDQCRGLTVCGSEFEPRALTEKDLSDLDHILSGDSFDIVAVSFCSSAADVLAVRDRVRAAGGDLLVMAKIETVRGVNNCLEIAQAADLVMAARGDLGLALPWVELPAAVGAIATAARAASKPWLLATQVVEGVEWFSAPTRAEVCDAARWLDDGCAGFLLSRETAFGTRPEAAVAAAAALLDRWAWPPELEVELVRELGRKAVSLLHGRSFRRAAHPARWEEESTTLPGDVSAPDLREPEPGELERLFQAGVSILQAGKVAILMLAGGESTRMGGVDRLKLPLRVGPETHTILALQEAKIGAVRQEYGPVPWLIMTSAATRKSTEELFTNRVSHPAPVDVVFFEQPSLPILGPDLEPLRAAKGRPRLSPTGHGGMLAALADSRILDRLPEGVEYLITFNYPNVMEKVCDPVLLGYHATSGCEVTTKAVPVTDCTPGERRQMGRVVRVGGRLRIAEYHLIQHLMDDPGIRDAPASTATHVWGVSFLRDRIANGVELPYYLLSRRNPDPPPGTFWKLEQFVFDLFQYAHGVGLMVVPKQAESMTVRTRDDIPEAERVLGIAFPTGLQPDTVLGRLAPDPKTRFADN